jgi:hypothetical protein
MKTNPVNDFILGQEQNFKIAASVSVAWRDARRQVLSEFLDRLESRLKVELNGWKFEREQEFYEDSWACLNFWKPAWDKQYGLSLMWDGYGKEMIFGVYRDKDNIGERLHCDELLKTVTSKIQLSVTKRPWWEARIRMKNPAADWSTAEILWRMHTEAKFLNEVAEQLLDLERISGTIVDRLAQGK